MAAAVYSRCVGMQIGMRTIKASSGPGGQESWAASSYVIWVSVDCCAGKVRQQIWCVVVVPSRSRRGTLRYDPNEKEGARVDSRQQQERARLGLGRGKQAIPRPCVRP